MRHIPNILSMCRIAMIPLFVYLMNRELAIPAAVTLTISGLTDLLDGLLARKFGWISQLGKVLDPVADKLTQVTVCIVLAVRFRRFWPFFTILLFKELIMLVLGGYLIKKGIKMEGAKWFGKVVTCLFYFTMVLMVFVTMPDWLVFALLGITTGCAVGAALMYIPVFLKYKRESTD